MRRQAGSERPPTEQSRRDSAAVVGWLLAVLLAVSWPLAGAGSDHSSLLGSKNDEMLQAMFEWMQEDRKEKSAPVSISKVTSDMWLTVQGKAKLEYKIVEDSQHLRQRIMCLHLNGMTIQSVPSLRGTCAI
ncbi:g8390 [Coccomyxa elongata]